MNARIGIALGIANVVGWEEAHQNIAPLPWGFVMTFAALMLCNLIIGKLDT